MNIALYHIFMSAALKYGLSVSLLAGICGVESNFNPAAINHHDGAPGSHSFGMCQIKYSTARMLGLPVSKHCTGQHIDKCPLFRPDINAEYAAKYLKEQLIRYNFDERKAVSAYNAGKFINGNRKYVDKVFKKKKEFEQ